MYVISANKLLVRLLAAIR